MSRGDRTFQAEFYSTYYFTNIIGNVLSERFDHLENLNTYYGDENYPRFLRGYQKATALHDFIRHMAYELFYEQDVLHVDLSEFFQPLEDWEIAIGEEPNRLWIEHAFIAHKIEFETFAEWMKEKRRSLEDADNDDAGGYYEDLILSGPMDKLLTALSDDVFFVAFSNRYLLASFHSMVAMRVSRLRIEEIDEAYRGQFQRDGLVKRKPIPVWARRAVFFRDRGKCCFCQADLSGLVSPHFDLNFDHIVPLAEGGINDVTNLQLTCGPCNKTKSRRGHYTKNTYERWYPVAEGDFEE